MFRREDALPRKSWWLNDWNPTVEGLEAGIARRFNERCRFFHLETAGGARL